MVLFYMTTNVLQDFHICISVPLIMSECKKDEITSLNVKNVQILQHNLERKPKTALRELINVIFSAKRLKLIF